MTGLRRATARRDRGQLAATARDWTPDPRHASRSHGPPATRPADRADGEERRSPTSSSIATARRCSPARAPTRARGSATRAIDLGGAPRRWASPRRCATSCQWYASLPGARRARSPCCDRPPRPRSGCPSTTAHGQFVYAIAEYYRYTHDVGFVQRAVAERRARGRLPDRGLRARRYGRRTSSRTSGLLRPPARIDQPRGLRRRIPSTRTGTTSSRCAGRGRGRHWRRSSATTSRAALAALRDAFRETLYASIRQRDGAARSIDYLPGSVELGDSRPDVDQRGTRARRRGRRLPPRALLRHASTATGSSSRRAQRPPATACSTLGYELRNVTSFVRLGRARSGARRSSTSSSGHSAPPAWNAWGRITWRDPEAPHFIGDMPQHTWVGAGVRPRACGAGRRTSAQSDSALVLARRRAAGVGDRGAGPRRYAGFRRTTACLNLTLHDGGPTTLATAAHAATSTCRRAASSCSRRSRGAAQGVVVNGRTLEGAGPATAVVRQFPADVVLQY